MALYIVIHLGNMYENDHSIIKFEGIEIILELSRPLFQYIRMMLHDSVTNRTNAHHLNISCHLVITGIRFS